jgi:hypothetical protein
MAWWLLSPIVYYYCRLNQGGNINLTVVKY